MTSPESLDGVIRPSAADHDLLIQAALGRILHIALEPRPLEEQLRRVLDVLLELPWLGIRPQGCIYLTENDPPELVMKVQRGLPTSVQEHCARVAAGTCLCGRALADGLPRFTTRLTLGHTIRHTGMGEHGHCLVPITAATRRLGLLNLYIDANQVLTPVQTQFLLLAADILAQMIERRRAEDRLRRSEERFTLAVRGSDAGIWDWDIRANRMYYSARWKSMLGYEEKEISCAIAEWEERLHPEDVDRVHESVRAYLDGRTDDYEMEFRLRHKDGSYRCILARGAAVRGPDGQPQRMVGWHLDITERKRAEEEERRTQAHVLAAQRVLELVRPRQPLDTPELTIHGACSAAEHVSGDYFTYFVLPDGAILTVVADVCGHGLEAAIVTDLVHTWLRALTGLRLDIGETLDRLNSGLMDQIDEDRFVTMLALRLDPRQRTLEYINAGHPSGHVLNQDGTIKARLDAASPPLALRRNAPFLIQGPVSLAAGDRVLLVTDGVFEPLSPQGDQFGIDRVLRHVAASLDQSGDQLLAGLFDEVRRHAATPALDDDLTGVLIHVK